jgi:hypothetical protein
MQFDDLEDAAYDSGRAAAVDAVVEVANAYTAGAEDALEEAGLGAPPAPVAFYGGDAVIYSSVPGSDPAQLVRDILNGVSAAMICLLLGLTGLGMYKGAQTQACSVKHGVSACTEAPTNATSVTPAPAPAPRTPAIRQAAN